MLTSNITFLLHALNCIRFCFWRCDFVMVALWNRADHYIFALWFLLSFFFFPRLISAVGDWMSAILPHMVCGLSANLGCRSETCSLKMHDAKKSPSVHHRTTLSGYIFTTKERIDNRKKLVKQQYLLYMFPQYGELQPTSG